jgi:hypothetical protein
VKGTLCENLQLIQRRFVAFAPFWLVLFWGFRGDTGTVVAAFGLGTRMRNGQRRAAKNLFNAGAANS